MAYERFAAYYDALNGDADYDRLAAHIVELLGQQGIDEGIVADLGCGTGELSLRLARAGYDMIAIDASPDMLNQLRDKMEALSQSPDILLLCQRLEQLDLYGTIRGAVSSFDTFNHLPPADLRACLAKVALFMESDGLLLFDVNTVYKHEQVLANNTFAAESGDGQGLVCEWENTLDKANQSTDITLEIRKNDTVIATEQFTEYYYTGEEWEAMLAGAGFAVVQLCDGETFGPPTAQSQRLLYAAKKR